MLTVFCKGRGLPTTKMICKIANLTRVREYVGVRTGKTRYKVSDYRDGIFRKSYLRALPTDCVLVNWASHHRELENAVVYNTVDAVKLSSNKGATRKKLQEAGVATPATAIVDGNNINEHSYDGIEFPAVARPPYHYGGKNFVYLENLEQYIAKRTDGTIKDGWYVSSYFEKNAEFRVHVAHGKILSVQRKVREDGNDPSQYRVWNHCESGFRFRPVKWTETDKKLLQTAMKALRVSGLDFAAIDIMAKLDPERVSKNEYSVCELNTSPALKAYMTKKYAQYFAWLAQSTERKPHYCIDVTKQKSEHFWRDSDFGDIQVGEPNYTEDDRDATDTEVCDECTE